MLALFKVSLLLLLVSHCECIQDVGDRTATSFGIEKLCSDSSLQLANKKLLCILCKGWDPTCWSTTSPSTTSTTTTTTTENKPNPPSLTTKASAPEAPEAPVE